MINLLYAQKFCVKDQHVAKAIYRAWFSAWRTILRCVYDSTVSAQRGKDDKTTV